MKIESIRNLKYLGANQRLSLLDVIFPNKVEPLPLIIFAHGFKGYKDWGHFPLLMEKLAAAGFCVLKFNFSHNGGTVENPIDFPDLESFAENNYLKEQADLDAILHWVQKDQALPMGKWDPERVYLIGHSRGGSMAILKAAHDARIKKVVSWAAVSDLIKRLPADDALREWKANGVRYIPNARTKQQMPMNYQFVEELMQNQELLSLKKACFRIKVPHLIIHGSQDETVPFESAESLHAWSSKSKLVCLKGANHTFGGKQPWSKNQPLPPEADALIKETIQFLKST